MKKNVPDLSEIYNLVDHDYNQRNIIPAHSAIAFQIPAPIPIVYASQSIYTPK